ncbi:MAG: hypothetical protein LBS56_03805, partial [Propionibacteriaceae bacterium]|nr:hypothetical protein [Propionibacteriaceae bacterium]
MRLRKHRAAEGRLLAEGPGAVREALAGGLVEALLATRAGAARHTDLTAGGWWEVDDKAMAELADTVTPSGLLAICRWEPARGLPGRPGRRPQTGPPGPGRGPRPPAGPAGAGRGPEEPSPDPALVVVCAQIRDPGNLGTVIRCADAFGATAVVVTAGSVDPANAKAVRASAGSLFHVPVLSGVPLADAVAD